MVEPLLRWEVALESLVVSAYMVFPQEFSSHLELCKYAMGNSLELSRRTVGPGVLFLRE